MKSNGMVKASSGKKPSSPETLNKWLRRGIAFLLFAFLVGLGHSLLRDVGRIDAPIRKISAEEQRLTLEVARLSKDRQEIQALIRDVSQGKAALRQKMDTSKGTFDDWVKAAPVGENPSGVVVGSLAETNAFRKEALALIEQESTLTRRLGVLETELAGVSSLKATVSRKADHIYANEVHTHALKAFGFRLALTLPPLLLGVWLFVRYRKHKYSPLVWGYAWFSAYLFFFGLVPYLPDFGGYIRYSVGILLTIWGGVKAIEAANAYAERRKRELAEDREARAKKVDSTAALLSLSTHACPSCGADWLLTSLGNTHPPYCSACGIALFKDCSCAAKRFAFLPNCPACGRGANPEQTVQPGEKTQA